MEDYFWVGINGKSYMITGWTEEFNLILKWGYTYDQLNALNRNGVDVHIVAKSEELVAKSNSLFCCYKKDKEFGGTCSRNCNGRGFSYELFNAYRFGEKIAVIVVNKSKK